MANLRSLLSSLATWATPGTEQASLPENEAVRAQHRQRRLEAITTYGNRIKTSELIALAMPRQVFKMLTRVDVLNSTVSYFTRQTFAAPEFDNQPQQLVTELTGNELFLTHLEKTPTGAFNMVKQLQGVIQGEYARVAIVSEPAAPGQSAYSRVMPYHRAQFAELRDLAQRYGTTGHARQPGQPEVRPAP